MQPIIKKTDLPREPAPDGVGGEQRVYLTNEISSPYFQAMTVRYLQLGEQGEWYSQAGVEEIIYILHGYGVLLHEKKKMTFKPGDCFVIAPIGLPTFSSPDFPFKQEKE